MSSIINQLTADTQRYQGAHLRDLFKADSERYNRYSIECQDLWINYSRNLIDDKTFALFYTFLNERQLKDKVEALFTGEVINQSESRKAMHPLLRASLDDSNPDSVAVHQQRHKIAELCQAVESNTYLINQLLMLFVLV